MNPRHCTPQPRPPESPAYRTLVRCTHLALLDPSPDKSVAVLEADDDLAGRLLLPSVFAHAAAEALRSAQTSPLDPRTLRSIRHWFVRCAEEGWLKFHHIDDALAALAAEFGLPPDDLRHLLKPARAA